MWARGVSASQPYLVIRMCLTPYMPSSAADVAPAGPLPTTSTSVSMGLLVILLSLVVLLVMILRSAPVSDAGSFRRRHHGLWHQPRAGLHLEIVGHQVPRAGDLLAVRQHRFALRLHPRDEFVLDPEHRVAPQVLVAIEEDVGDQRLVAFRLDQEVDVCGPHWMT